MRRIAIGVFALALTASAAHADPVDDVVREQMAVSHLPGVAVAVIDHGRVTKLAGYGLANLEWSQPVGPDTRFQLASATKLFTAVLLMRLVEQDRLSLDDPIAKFFPGAPQSWSGITVRQLADHSSGLSENLGTPAPQTVEETVGAAMRQPLAYAPGSESRYGFTDFTVLRAVLEKVGGASLPDLLDREIVRPLGLTSTGFELATEDGPVRTGEVLAQRASVYGWNGERQRTSDFFFTPTGYGAGGLYSSARDLATFFAALDQGELLSPASLKAVATPPTLASGKVGGFGVGWVVKSYRGVQVIGHSGGPALADIVRIPSTGRTVVVLTNQKIFFPVLAERIADLTLPEPALSPVRDERPQVAANVEGLFAAVLSGADPSAYVAGDPAAPLRSEFGRALIEAVGPVEKVALARVEPDGARVYRIRFARKSMDWRFDVDAQDRITAMRPL